MTLSLSKLEELAKAATPGPWIKRSDCAVYDSINEQVCFIAHNRQNTNFIDSFNPQTALALIAVCRLAKEYTTRQCRVRACEELLKTLEEIE